jgi:hypothetical protein
VTSLWNEVVSVVRTKAGVTVRVALPGRRAFHLRPELLPEFIAVLQAAEAELAAAQEREP